MKRLKLRTLNNIVIILCPCIGIVLLWSIINTFHFYQHNYYYPLLTSSTSSNKPSNNQKIPTTTLISKSSTNNNQPPISPLIINHNTTTWNHNTTTTTTTTLKNSTCSHYTSRITCETDTCEWDNLKLRCSPLPISWTPGRPCSTSRIHTNHARRCLFILRYYANHILKTSKLKSQKEMMSTFVTSLDELFSSFNIVDPLLQTIHLQKPKRKKPLSLQELQSLLAKTRLATGIESRIILMSGTGGSGSRAFVQLLRDTKLVVPVVNNNEMDFLLGNGGYHAGRNLQLWQGNPCPPETNIVENSTTITSSIIIKPHYKNFLATLERTTWALIAAYYTAAFDIQNIKGPTVIAIKHGSLIADAVLIALLLHPENIFFIHYVRNGHHMIISRNKNQLFYYTKAFQHEIDIVQDSEDVQKAKLWSLLNVALWKCFQPTTTSNVLYPSATYVLVRYDDYINMTQPVSNDLQSFLSSAVISSKQPYLSHPLHIDRLRRKIFISKEERELYSDNGTATTTTTVNMTAIMEKKLLQQQRIDTVMKDNVTRIIFENGLKIFNYL
jgi:hypothetical protein